MQLFLVGMMGVGKSYWAKRLGQYLKLPVYDLDDVIEHYSNRTVASIFSHEGEEYFRELEKEVLRSFASEPGYILSCGGGTPCFHNNMEWMNKQGITIWIDETVEVIAERLLEAKKVRPLIKEIEREPLKMFLSQTINTRTAYYQKARFLIRQPDTISDFIKILEING